MYFVKMIETYLYNILLLQFPVFSDYIFHIRTLFPLKSITYFNYIKLMLNAENMEITFKRNYTRKLNC